MSKEKPQIDLIKDGQRPTVDIDLEKSNTLEDMNERILQSLQGYKFRDERIKEGVVTQCSQRCLASHQRRDNQREIKMEGNKTIYPYGSEKLYV